MSEPVRLVVWDLDETFWKGTLTEGGIREYVQAHHDIVIELARRGILSSICSKNDSAAILPILEEKGIAEYFIFPSITWEPKGPRLAQLVETVQLRAPTILFIDDNVSNRAEAAAMVPGLQIENETFIPRMLDDPRFKGKDDRELTRLKQYKLLEQRKRDEGQASGGNEVFLRGCEIKVYIEHDIEAHIDRAVELINRTNQLNYTKKRLPENPEAARDALRAQLKPFDRTAGLVRVFDRYGDYGFVGFFMLATQRSQIVPGCANTRLLHYCFSCRTLGMLIEDWVYNLLGRPELNVAGEVLTDLSVNRQVDWVTQTQTIDKAVETHQKIAPQIVMYGGCEVNSIGVYLNGYTDKLDLYGNYVANGMMVRMNYADRFLDICDRNAQDITPELEILGLPVHLEAVDILGSATPGCIFVLNLASELGGGNQLRHKTEAWTFVVEPSAFVNGESMFVTDKTTLQELLNSKKNVISDAHRFHIMKVSEHLTAHYERMPRRTQHNQLDGLEEIIERIPKDCKLVLLIDQHKRRKDPTSNEFISNPDLIRYLNRVQEMVAEYDYVGVVSIGDKIHSDSEILEADHYSREVYFRIAQGVVEVAKQIKVRSDVPVSKHRLTKMLVARREVRRQTSESREYVQTLYEVLLGRSPEAGVIEQVAPLLATGQRSYSKYLRAVAGSREFQARWRLARDKAPA